MGGKGGKRSEKGGRGTRKDQKFAIGRKTPD